MDNQMSKDQENLPHSHKARFTVPNLPPTVYPCASHIEGEVAPDRKKWYCYLS